jgi:1-pyrroline-5-carboxylate dehydrogenase
MREALAAVEAELGRRYPLVIGGKEIRTSAEIASLNPAHPSQVIGRCGSAGPAEVDAALDSARAAFPAWARTPPEERAAVLDRAAALLEERRFRLDALMALEAGKPWLEGDTEVSEAIDFCRFYAAEMRRLAEPRRTQEVAGELCHEDWVPRGVGVVISPWNFPLAILTGLTVAPLVAGNAVVMKPSGQTSVLAAWLFQALAEAGLPPGVLAYLPGPGGTVGARLCEDPRTDFIAFTGSREVGLHINKSAAQQQKGQIWIKRVILEMGGKDAIVVDADGDFDAAVEGVAQSAFGFQGQKCSACSRAIIDERIYDKFLEALKARVQKIGLGDPTTNPGMAAVINKSSMESILRYIQKAQQEGGRLITGGGKAEGLGDGFFVQPTVIADVKPTDTIAQEEIFGPVLAVIKAKNFDEALAIANGTEFGLTGAVYTSNPDKIERAMREFHVGNLYINRKCTAAIVGAHPFGGFNMSGTDSKTGGPDYLLLFTQAKSIGKKLV